MGATMKKDKKMGLIKKQDERGFALVFALVVLMILTLLGIAALNRSNVESMIATNDWVAKRALYKAESGADIGIQTLEYNFACGPLEAADLGAGKRPLNLLTIGEKQPKFLERKKVEDDYHSAHGVRLPQPQYPRDTERSLCWASSDPFTQLKNPSAKVLPNATDCQTGSGAEHTNVAMHGIREEDPGDSSSISEGYEGAVSPGGSNLSYRHAIYARNINNGGSGAETTILVHWRHKVGMENTETCR